MTWLTLVVALCVAQLPVVVLLVGARIAGRRHACAAGLVVSRRGAALLGLSGSSSSTWAPPLPPREPPVSPVSLALLSLQ